MIDITNEGKGKFWTTLNEARPGENIVYAKGSTCNGPHRADAAEAHDQGLVTLVQRRRGYADFEYIAQKLARKGKKK